MANTPRTGPESTSFYSAKYGEDPDPRELENTLGYGGSFTSLDELLEAMRNSDPRVMDDHGQWRTNLPTFGGAEPAPICGVWSWDADRIIYGSCAGDVWILAR